MPRIAIVTGAASGIGRALAGAAVDRGATVIVADVDGDGAARAATELNARGDGKAEAAQVDVRDAAAVQELVDRTVGDHGRLDFLFNNAGIAIGGPPRELVLGHWERTLDVNLRGVIHGCHAAWPIMREQGHGHIVNTASIAGLTATAGATPYTVSKHAVVGLSLGLRLDGSLCGIRVSALCPGFVDTPIIESDAPADLPPIPTMARVDLREMVERMGRLYSPERLAQATMRGLARDQAIIVAPFEARLTWRLWSHAPRTYLAIAERVTAYNQRWLDERWPEDAATV